MKVSIYRFDPSKDAKPYMQSFDVDLNKHKVNMLLDLLHLIKKEYDESLSFRRACGQGVCGSDGININGRNGLACITPIKDLGNHVTLRPLPGMPVIRDLIVDMDNFYNQYKKIKPYVVPAKELPAKEFLQSPKEREKLDGLYECILCGCCSAGCPSYWWNPEKFVGPAAALQAARFINDSRDGLTEERLYQLQDAYSIYRCRTILNCAEVCPKGLNPSKAISSIKHRLLDDSV